MSAEEPLAWIVIRQDDNGNRYELGRYATEQAAQVVVEEFERRGHKQLYFVTRDASLTPDLD